MNIDIYKTLTYDEDERKRIPCAYSHATLGGLGGNRKCQHVTVREPKIIHEFLSKFEFSQIANDNLSLSILWNLPRKQYGETDMWVNISGFTYSNDTPFSPNKFVIADNIVTEDAQKRALEVLEFLQEKVSDIEIDYGVPEYRFECNCKTDAELAEMLDEAHKAENGFNYEIGARLWYTPEGLDKTIMVEFDMTTQDCRDLVENQDEPDWFTAYEVDDEQDYDCSDEIFTETADNYISISGLKEAMADFARNVFNRFYVQEQSSLAEQIQSASARAADSHALPDVPVKSQGPEL